MPSITTTRRIAAVVAAAAAFAAPAAAGAIEVQGPDNPLLEAIKEDAQRLGSTVQRTADEIAPNTRAYAQHTVGRAASRTAGRVSRIHGDTHRTARRTRRDAQRRVSRCSVRYSADLRNTTVSAGAGC